MVSLFAIMAIAVAICFFTVPRKQLFVSIPRWFALASVLFINLAFVSRYLNVRHSQKMFLETGVLVVSLGLLSFVAAVLLTEFVSVKRAKLKQPASPRAATKRLLALGIVILIPSWTYFVLLGSVPLFDGLGAVGSQGLDGLGELQAARLGRDATVSDSASRIPLQGLWEIARNIGAPMVAALAVAQLNRGYSRTPRVILLALSIGTVLLAGQRWPLMYVMLAILMAFAATSRHKKKKFLIIPGALLAGIGVGMSVLQARTLTEFSSWKEAIGFGASNLVQRVFEEQALTPILSYERQSFEPGELLGRSYADSLGAYLPGPGSSFPVEFYARTMGDDRGFTAAPDFYTESFINFGFGGVIIVAFIWGIVLSKLDYINYSLDRDTDVALRAGVAAVMAFSCFTGPVFTIGGLLFVLIGRLSTQFIAGNEKTGHRKTLSNAANERGIRRVGFRSG